MLLCTLNFNFFMRCSYQFSGFFRFCRRGFNTPPVSSKLSEDKPFLFCSFRLFDTLLVSKDTLQLAFFYLLWGEPSSSESLRKSSGSILLSKLLSAFSAKVSLNSQEKDKSLHLDAKAGSTLDLTNISLISLNLLEGSLPGDTSI